MKREWSPEDLANHWSLLFEELGLLTGRTNIAKLGFSVLLKFFHIEYRFPERQQEVPAPAIEYVAKQIGEPSSLWHRYDLAGRSARRHRAQIRELLGFAETSAESIEEARAWLKLEILPQDPHLERASLALSGHLKARRIEVPPPAHARRLAEEALAELHREISSSIVAKLPDSTRRRLDALLIPTPASDDASEPTETAPIHKLRADPGQTSVESILEEISKLVLLRSIELPADLFSGYSNRFLAAFRQRVFVSETFELKRHPEPLRLTLLSAFTYLRSREVTDSLVDLLNSLVHRMGTHAEKRVETEFIENIRRVAGKTGILFRIADAAVENPDGIVREVIFPIASESLLKALVEEWKASGPAYQQKVRKVMKQSYSFHYRRALPQMMEMLEFRSNNETHRPVLIAVALVKKYMTSKVQWYPETETIPIEDIVRAGWEDGVIETREDGSKRVNRFAYELCVLQALRERLRCKEIWVVGADRYRNPEEDLPKDFDEKRQTYYEELSLPHEAQGFIDQLKSEMHSALSLFNENLPRNEFVKLLERRGGWISLSPLKPQPEPEDFALMKRELADRWPMTSLLDILKEADLSVDFTGRFRSPTAYERLDRSLLQQRLLLCLYGLGTNTGLKRMTSSML